MRRFFEIVPGALSWSFLILLFVIVITSPVLGAVVIITYDLYWMLRIGYFTTLMIWGHLRLHREEKIDWFARLKTLVSPHGSYQSFYHAVLFPVYNELFETLDASVGAVARNHYDLKRVIIVLAGEERADPGTLKGLERIQEKYAGTFKAVLLTVHPDGLESEAKVKGANATWAARRLLEWSREEGIELDKIILSCFDADTISHPQYLACLTHSFLVQPNPHQMSYQPIPVYNNNIWHAPSFARVVEISSSFWQLVQSMRRDKLVTFSSHSMSFKTLVEVNYWPVDMVSDDSAIFWRAFLHFDGNYHVVPLSVTVSMDVAFGPGFFGTVMHQYKQKRRWAWGVENFPVLMEGFLKSRNISLLKKLERAFQLLEEHFTWATWAIVLAFISAIPLLFQGGAFRNTVIGFNYPFITGFLFSVTSVSFLVCIIASFSLLPDKPREVPLYRVFTMCTQWLFIPFVSAVIGSIPALDAQTRLMLARPLTFWVTPKRRIPAA